VLRGQIRSLDDRPIAGATLDMWQAGADGYYSGFHPDTPAGNLRGRVVTDAEGRFEVETVLPGPYTIPLEGPCGELCRAAGWSPWRPGHLHLIVGGPGHDPLTTQLFFEGEEYLDNDVASAVKPELILRPDEEPGDGSGRRRYKELADMASRCSCPKRDSTIRSVRWHDSARHRRRRAPTDH
jgi:catechol 1,2-dioxygenase